jgi:hypothetical protein
MGACRRRWRRALEVTRVARRTGLVRVLAEIGVVGDKPATREGAEEFRRALESSAVGFALSFVLGLYWSGRSSGRPASSS